MAEVHARAIRTAGGTPVAIVSSSADRSADAARRLAIPVAAPDLDSLLIDPSIDVIHICTPNSTHADLSFRALRAGKHVVCEKPLATSVEVSARLVEAAKESGRIAAVPFIYRFHPMVREARARVARGDLGRLLTVSGSYLQDWLLSARDSNWRVNSDQGGPSRAFADIGSHLVDLIEFVTGERIIGLQARLRTVHERRGGAAVDTEDLASVLIETETGMLGTLLVSQVAPGRKNALAFELAGEFESLRFEQERPEELWIGRPRGSELQLRNPDELSVDARRLSAAPAGHPLGYLDAFAAFIGDTYAAINGRAHEGLPLFADGLRAARVTDAVMTSARTRTWVKL